MALTARHWHAFPREICFLRPIYSVFKGCYRHIVNNFYISGFFVAHFRFLPYVGMVTIIMNDYPKFKVGIYVCVCLFQKNIGAFTCTTIKMQFV